MELVNEKRGSTRRGSKKDEEEARRGRMEKFSLFGDALGVVGWNWKVKSFVLIFRTCTKKLRLEF